VTAEIQRSASISFARFQRADIDTLRAERGGARCRRSVGEGVIAVLGKLDRLESRGLE
jgi:hypothetical protein